jgi:hypothetical protein
MTSKLHEVFKCAGKFEDMDIRTDLFGEKEGSITEECIEPKTRLRENFSKLRLKPDIKQIVDLSRALKEFRYDQFIYLFKLFFAKLRKVSGIQQPFTDPPVPDRTDIPAQFPCFLLLIWWLCNVQRGPKST